MTNDKSGDRKRATRLMTKAGIAYVNLSTKYAAPPLLVLFVHRTLFLGDNFTYDYERLENKRKTTEKYNGYIELFTKINIRYNPVYNTRRCLTTIQ